MIKVNGLGVSRIPINGKETLRVMKNGGQLWSKSGLPNGYTLLEYIQATGSQWIDTGFIPKQDTSIYMDVTPTSVSSSTIGGIFLGSSTPDHLHGVEIYVHNNVIVTCWGGSYEYGTITINANDRLNVRLEKNVSRVYRGTSLVYNKTFSPVTFVSGTSLKLGHLPRNSKYYGAIKIYSCQVYDNGNLVRDFIPCKNPSGVYGLYDKVNKQFYASASSTPFTGA